ncbi:MAG: arsenic efflux protein [Clostridia bacterium]|nr:arsenic efflux protein [Clostridia bacterium]
MEHFWEFLLHALQDTWPLLPWVLLIYILIELLESKTNLQSANRFGGKLGPLVGAATGLIPQCGFSVMAAKLFERKYITVGTLLAIFFSTSDEAFIILLSDGVGAKWVLPTLGVKIVVSVLVGYGADLLLKWLGRGQVCVEVQKMPVTTPQTTHEIFISRYLEEQQVGSVCACGKQHGDSAWRKYLLSPLLHTLQVAAFIFLVNFALTAIIHTVGEATFAAFMNRNRFIQPFITCAVGLIPNCASSVVITETFLSGGITFGSFVAGLCANAGMGFVILLKNTRKWKRNVFLIVCTYALAVIIGLLCNLFPITA